MNTKQKLKNFGGRFDVEGKKEQLSALEAKASVEDFWNNVDFANEISTKISNIRKDILEIDDIKSKIANLKELVEMLNDEDLESIAEVSKELIDMKSLFDAIYIKSLLNKKYDKYNCILEIHPGAGGTESCDWASMLLRMYQKYSMKKGYKFEILEEQRGEEAGIKSVTAKITGLNAYGYLKSERGVHRLVRISPFDSNARRHTSFASVSIIPEVENDQSIEINPSDIKIDVFHSGGAGGQSVNTTDSAVRITHLPTKTVVSCQNERSQLKNKETAMSILLSKLTILKEEELQQEAAKLKGENININFGSQIRSYTLEPYTLIKDNRFEFETSDVDKFLDGELDEMIEAYLKNSINQ